jgi:transposase-like protein
MVAFQHERYIVTQSPSHPKTSPRGGPRTPTGKLQTRGNATKHGLTATTLLPAILGPEVLQEYLLRLRAEWQPQTPTQGLLIAEMARHAAALERIESAELAVLRSGANAVSRLQLGKNAHDNAPDDADEFILAAAVSTDGIDRVTRYRRAHEKGFHQALQRLREIRGEPRIVPQLVRVAQPFPFTENACRDHLIRRMITPEYRCPHCGHPAGYWLAARSRWECTRCGRQSGLRAGTIMERSPLPISTWFAAIWLMLTNPSASRDEVTKATKLSRPNTVRQVTEKITAAMASPNATCLLAGLNLICRIQPPMIS